MFRKLRPSSHGEGTETQARVLLGLLPCASPLGGPDFIALTEHQTKIRGLNRRFKII